MDIQSFLKTKIATWLLGIVLAFTMLFTAKILIEQHRVNGQITKLQQQADKITKDNQELSYLIEYYNTAEYQEKQAREKLNLKKEGEEVISLPAVSEEEELHPEQKEESNFQKWLNYLFPQNEQT